MPRISKKALIEKIVSQVDDYDIDTIIEGYKSMMRRNLSKLSVRTLQKEAKLLDEATGDEQ